MIPIDKITKQVTAFKPLWFKTIASSKRITNKNGNPESKTFIPLRMTLTRSILKTNRIAKKIATLK